MAEHDQQPGDPALYRSVRIASGAIVRVSGGMPEELDDRLRTARTGDEAAEMIRAQLRGEPITRQVEGWPPGWLKAPDLPIVRSMKLCVFRTCTWEVAEPEGMEGWPGVEAKIRKHLRTEHRDAIELMSAAIR